METYKLEKTLIIIKSNH